MKIEKAIESLKDDIKSCEQSCNINIPFYKEKIKVYKMAISALEQKQLNQP